MADGGQATDQWGVVERAARRLASALGYGSSWHAETQVVSRDNPSGFEDLGTQSFPIAKRGRVTEQAARSVAGGTRVKRRQEWRRSGCEVAISSTRMDQDALAALSYAKLDGPLEAILCLYATGDVHRYWPTVERFGLACERIADARHPLKDGSEHRHAALTDAMQRILCGSAAVPQDARAKELGMRAANFRQTTRAYEAKLRSWLLVAAGRYNTALGET